MSLEPFKIKTPLFANKSSLFWHFPKILLVISWYVCWMKGLVHMIVVNAVYRYPRIVKLRGPQHFQKNLKIDYLMVNVHFLYTTVDL